LAEEIQCQEKEVIIEISKAWRAFVDLILPKSRANNLVFMVQALEVPQAFQLIIRVGTIA
jgi:hypothetical protein